MQSNMPTNQVILVDDYDQPIGQAEKHFAHEQGLLHRAISIVVFRYQPGSGLEFLMQKRAACKYHAPNCWSNSCCSHPLPKESIYDAAHRRLKEELGLSLPIVYLDRLRYEAKVSETMIEHEIDHIYVAHDDGQSIVPNPEEVSEVKWVKLSDCKHGMYAFKKDYEVSPWCHWVMQIVINHQSKILSLL